MKRTFPAVMLALIISFTVGFSAATAFKSDSVYLTNESGSLKSSNKDDSYILKEHGGYLSVFKPNHSSPVMVFDKSVDLLPEYDRNELKRGVVAENYKELTRLIEDYIS